MWFSSGLIKEAHLDAARKPSTLGHRRGSQPQHGEFTVIKMRSALTCHTQAHSTLTNSAHTLRDLHLPKRFQGSRGWLLSLCQVPQINCSLHHSYFCLFTLCSRHGRSVTSPYYLYVHFFLPPSVLLLLSVCLCPGWKRGNVFIVSG